MYPILAVSAERYEREWSDRTKEVSPRRGVAGILPMIIDRAKAEATVECGSPNNVDPGDSKLADPEDRARMARVFDQGLNTPRGFVLPIQRWNAEAPRWRSERWQLRRGNLFLMPGDSPLGLRLPISSLPYIPPEDYPYVVEQDPMPFGFKLICPNMSVP